MTVLNLLALLDEIPSTRLLTNSPDFKYFNRDKELPKFVPNSEGSYITGISYTSGRQSVNISAITCGSVELPENIFRDSVPAKTFRHYTVVKDGKLNMNHLPVLIHVDDYSDSRFLEYPNVAGEYDHEYMVVVFDLTKLLIHDLELFDPKMFSELASSVETDKANQKVLNWITRETKALVEKLEPTAEESYLESCCVKDGWFAKTYPKGDREYTFDMIQTKIKGLSSLPSIEAVEKKIVDNKKLNLADQLIKTGLETYSDLPFETIKQIQKSIKLNRKQKENIIAQYVFAMIDHGFDKEINESINGDNIFPVTIEKIKKTIKV